MKYLGILIMAGAAVLLGFSAAERFRERLEILLLLRQMVYHLKNQIMYSNATLPEALTEVGARFSGGHERDPEPGKFFQRVGGRLEKEAEKAFREIWCEEILKIPESVSLNKADREALKSLGDHLGYADRTMQERTLMFYIEQTDDSIANLKKEVEERTKLYRCLGMAAGLFIMVILT